MVNNAPSSRGKVVDPNPSKIINDPPIQIVGQESIDDENMIDYPNSGEERIAARSNNNNEYNIPATKIETIYRSVKCLVNRNINY